MNCKFFAEPPAPGGCVKGIPCMECLLSAILLELRAKKTPMMPMGIADEEMMPPGQGVRIGDDGKAYFPGETQGQEFPSMASSKLPWVAKKESEPGD